MLSHVGFQMAQRRVWSYYLAAALYPHSSSSSVLVSSRCIAHDRGGKTKCHQAETNAHSGNTCLTKQTQRQPLELRCTQSRKWTHLENKQNPGRLNHDDTSWSSFSFLDTLKTKLVNDMILDFFAATWRVNRGLRSAVRQSTIEPSDR